MVSVHKSEDAKGIPMIEIALWIIGGYALIILFEAFVYRVRMGIRTELIVGSFIILFIAVYVGVAIVRIMRVVTG